MRQKRILMFVQDGSGLGHLSRMCRIASFLQGVYAVLIVTGKREASWMVPEACEFIHVPSWRSLRKKLAQHWGKDVWLHVEDEIAIKMISDFNQSAVNIFQPDVIINDYLPFGKFAELRAVLQNSNAKKYLILRGIIDKSDKELFFGDTLNLLEDVYDRVLVACDHRIIDVRSQYDFSLRLTSKTETIGYVPTCEFDTFAVRMKNNIVRGSRWVVCSAGGGKNAEQFLSACIEAAAVFPEVTFDIVYGPYARTEYLYKNTIPDNCRVYMEKLNLPEMLYSCDVAITNGGYNSMVESISGGAYVIVYSNQLNGDDEQVSHASKLSRYCPVAILESKDAIGRALSDAFLYIGKNTRSKPSLNFMGLEKLKQIIDADLRH
jgi:predicted glycosyltransferase